MARLTKPWSKAVTDYIDTHITADFETGLLYWKCDNPRNKNRAGDLRRTSLCNPKPRQYLCFGSRIAGKFKILKVHQVIFYLYHGRQAQLWIDHIDNNPLNNAVSNLREVTPMQNANNPNNDNKRLCNMPGVYKRPNRERYWSTIRINGKSHYLGSYSTAAEAQQAYINASGRLSTNVRV